MRCFASDDPLKVAGGTPLLAGSSRTEWLFQRGTQEHRYVPCPHCGHRQVLVFGAAAMTIVTPLRKGSVLEAGRVRIR